MLRETHPISFTLYRQLLPNSACASLFNFSIHSPLLILSSHHKRRLLQALLLPPPFLTSPSRTPSLSLSTLTLHPRYSRHVAVSLPHTDSDAVPAVKATNRSGSEIETGRQKQRDGARRKRATSLKASPDQHSRIDEKQKREQYRGHRQARLDVR